MAQTIGNITIDNGSIIVAGKEVGTVMQDLKHGYHPAVAIRIGKKVEWLEVDTRDLIGVIWVMVREMLEAEELI